MIVNKQEVMNCPICKAPFHRFACSGAGYTAFTVNDEGEVGIDVEAERAYRLSRMKERSESQQEDVDNGRS